MMMRTTLFIAAVTAVASANVPIDDVPMDAAPTDNVPKNDAPTDDVPIDDAVKTPMDVIDCTDACRVLGDVTATCTWVNKPVCTCTDSSFTGEFCLKPEMENDKVKIMMTFGWSIPCMGNGSANRTEFERVFVEEAGASVPVWSCGSLHASVVVQSTAGDFETQAGVVASAVRAESSKQNLPVPSVLTTVNSSPCTAEFAATSTVVNGTCYAVTCIEGYKKENDKLATPCTQIRATKAPVTEAPATDSPSSSGLSDGAIAGIAIGCAVFVGIVAGGIYYFLQRGTPETTNEPASDIEANKANAV